MQDSKIIPTWKSWLKIGRLIPLLTISAAAIVGILSLLGRFQVTMAEGVIIALLTLLAVDALVERLSLLEKIDERLGRLPAQEFLQDRSQLIRMEELAANATEIWAAGITLVSILHPYYHFYLRKLRDGCNLRFMVLDPGSGAAKIRDKQLPATTITEDIRTTLVVLGNLRSQKELKGKCEVRLSPSYLPFSLVIVDGTKDKGRMIVELLTYKTDLGQRPHLILRKQENYRWFDFFNGQFEGLWKDSTPVANRQKVMVK